MAGSHTGSDTGSDTGRDTGSDPGLAGLNALADEAARDHLRQCCSSRRWADAVLARRPFARAQEVFAASDAAFSTLTPRDIDEALAGHPRIGDRPPGERQDAQWSRQEQSSVADAGADVHEQLRRGNAAYEHRFDRVFLIRAAGRSPQEMLAELTRRLDNDDDTESAEVAEQLRQITRLRLERLFPS